MDEFKSSLKEEKLAIPFSMFIMYLIGHFKQEWWVEIFAITVGWVVADVLLNGIFITGGQSAVKIPALGYLFQSEGYTYLAFLSGIVFSTWASTFSIKLIRDWLSSTGHPVSFAAIFVGALVYADLRARYYAQKKRQQP